MNNPRQQPVHNPQRFIGSVFDLAYGARDGSESLSPAEIKANLREAGIDPEAAWKEFSTLLQPQAKRESLAAARKARLAAPAPILATQARAPRTTLLAELKRLMSELAGQGEVFARGWEDTTDGDLALVCSQLRRQIERSKSE